MNLAYRLLLILGHTLGDFALPFLGRLCKRAGTSFEVLTPDEAEEMLPTVEHVLGAYVLNARDLSATMHEMRVEIGNERFARSGASVPLTQAQRLGANAAAQPEGG